LALGIPNQSDDLEPRGDAATDAPTIDEVQRHFARELHDQVAQPLIDVMLELQHLRASLEDTNPLASDLAKLEESTRQVLRHARESMIDLRRRGELRINLIQALENELPIPPGHDLSLRVTRRWPRQTNGWAAFNLLRIIQQAVANAWRHGRAERIDVVLDVGPANDAVVVVLDDGVGIDDAPRGFGMVGMEERATILGGTFSVGPRHTGGTRVEVRVPLSRLE
jgi:two-component system, NarL family, sensor histidine kinase UhpB